MRILLIEDSHELCDSLSFQLANEGCFVDTCEDGADAFYYIDQKIYDFILLDCLLPHMDGRSILKRLRRLGDTTPVIFLTALGELDDKINGLEAGADDYLVKPFAFEELMARIRCISRRPRQWSINEDISAGDITYSVHENKLTGPEGCCTLSKKEGALLRVFMQNKSQTLPRMTLLTKVWGPDAEVEEGNLDNYIYFIRRRLKTVGSVIKIKTIRSVGYQMQNVQAL